MTATVAVKGIKKTEMKIRLKLINQESHAPVVTDVCGEMLNPMVCYDPLRIRKPDGSIIETRSVIAFGNGWCTTADGTYSVSHSRESIQKSKDGQIDCGVEWSNEHHLLAALFHARQSEIPFDCGPLRPALGIRETISGNLSTTLLGIEQELRQTHQCSAPQVVTTLRAMISSIAAAWYTGLVGTDWEDLLLIIHHETDLLRQEGRERLTFVSVYHGGVVTHCRPDEIPAIDYELGDNMRRLRAIIEKWER